MPGSRIQFFFCNSNFYDFPYFGLFLDQFCSQNINPFPVTLLSRSEGGEESLALDARNLPRIKFRHCSSDRRPEVSKIAHALSKVRGKP